MTDTVYNFALDGYAMSHGDCFLAQFSDVPCEGRMERAHLLRLQTLRRELRKLDLPADELLALLWSPAVWRPGCTLHHGLLDKARRLRIPRDAIPADTEAFADTYGLAWWLAREYGERSVAA